mmetsp:Transcript_13335/g.21918  ORF Transcript_13335/g.21918 Transcript_13335/m.21918 type:complete len:1036 (-) Transcript_13335:37-3144(-)
MSPRQYGSISSGSDGDQESVELIPPHGGNVARTIDVQVSGDILGPLKERKWFHYALAVLLGVMSVGYLHSRFHRPQLVDHGVEDDSNAVRVPMPKPLSSLDPISDLGFRSTKRSGLASPSKVWQQFAHDKNDQHEFTKPLPTNAWYMNLLSHKAAKNPSSAGEVAHVYSIPYIVGVSPQNPKNMPITTTSTSIMAGIDLFLPVMKASSKNMQMVFDKQNGVSLGALVDQKKVKNIGEDDAPTSYHVINDESSTSISPLGVGLQWNHVDMKSFIVRGMPYGTVAYGKDVLPTILSGNRPTSIIIDNDESNKMQCGSLTGKPVEQVPSMKAPISKDGKANTYTVENELVFHLKQSDFTWAVFFSKPVKLRCFSDAVPMVSVAAPSEEVQFRVDVIEVLSEDDDDELVVRMAVASECTTGRSTMNGHCDRTLGYDTVSTNMEKYLEILRKGKDSYPKNPLVGVDFPKEDDEVNERVSNVVIDWDFTSIKANKSAATDHASNKLRGVARSTKNDDDGASIMFALPHHLESLSDKESSMCFHTFHGRTCLVHGTTWDLPVKHGAPQSFLADRPPLAHVIPAIARALKVDIKFQFSSNVLRGAADTYFPAKIMSKVGRVIEIAYELKQLSDGVAPDYADADESTVVESASAAAAVDLPSDSEIESLLDELQESVEIFLKPGGKAEKGGEAEFLFDESWGGFLNCGCKYTFDKESPDKGTCSNVFPSCPALADVNEDFGNGFYNDHHFHYGYHCYAAAVVAKHRPEWGKRMYERVLMYVRDIANPSYFDKHYPMFRQKDFYLGNSWAAGLMSMELSPHGREQESSSEAIAAFEGISLFGAAMMSAFKDDAENLESARLVRNVGEFLTSMEIEAANRFWHVWGEQEGSTSNSSVVKDSTLSTHTNTYSSLYTKKVVGMMHDTMASFQTWFAPQDVVSYGIQLIPFTAVAQRRDDPEWTKELYPVYAKSCEIADMGSGQNSGFCMKNGWSIVQAGLLAETGKIDEAVSMAKDIPSKIYLSEGANGHSATNTLWFISTRKRDEAQ